MDRRNFFKLVGTASGGALTGACGNTGREIIPLLVPEEQIVPGVEQWRPSVCCECSSGCGIIVRIMQSERETVVEGEKVREPLAAVKKIEGNPLDPVSGGRLCARGQAGVQSLYHPDRLRVPKKRTGERGRAEFEDLSWEEALEQAAGMLSEAIERNPQGIVYLSGPGAGSRSTSVGRFLDAVGAEPASTAGVDDFSIERAAAEQVFGWQGLPVYDVHDATYILSIGADWLGGWASPVFYARRFGHFRQGRPGLRGRLFHAEGRLSQTGWSADKWLPVAPEGEHALALAIGHLLLVRGWARSPEAVPKSVRETLISLDLSQAARLAGLEVHQIEQVARELAEASAPLVIAGASIVRRNSLDAVIAGCLLNLLLGNVGQKGGVQAPAPEFEIAADRPAYRDLESRLSQADLILLDGANPAYTSPHLAGPLAESRAVINFSPFLDDSAAFADLLLPDHSPMESAELVIPEVADRFSVTGSRAFVRPLYDTRATEEVLAELAKRVEKPFEAPPPSSILEEIFENRVAKGEWENAAEFVRYCERQGGWWQEAEDAPPAKPVLSSLTGLEDAPSQGGADDYPFRFQAYLSLQFGDGAGANLPWLQQLPDPTSSAMWNLPVEIDPGTATKLGLSNGDWVKVTSPAASLEAPVYVNPAAIPGVVSMAAGQGHTHYGRYAGGRGTNPFMLVAGSRERSTGVPAFGSARVRLEKIPERHGLVQFSSVDREIQPQRS